MEYKTRYVNMATQVQQHILFRYKLLSILMPQQREYFNLYSQHGCCHKSFMAYKACIRRAFIVRSSSAVQLNLIWQTIREVPISSF
jgi:hypothetical protein